MVAGASLYSSCSTSIRGAAPLEGHGVSLSRAPQEYVPAPLLPLVVLLSALRSRLWHGSGPSDPRLWRDRGQRYAFNGRPAVRHRGSAAFGGDNPLLDLPFAPALYLISPVPVPSSLVWGVDWWAPCPPIPPLVGLEAYLCPRSRRRRGSEGGLRGAKAKGKAVQRLKANGFPKAVVGGGRPQAWKRRNPSFGNLSPAAAAAGTLPTQPPYPRCGGRARA